MIVAIDLDGMLLAFPDFFKTFVPAMQAGGCKVGVLTARTEDEKDGIEEALKEGGFKMDFCVTKPSDFSSSDGTFKAIVCKEFDVDILFDDFETNDPKMLADFFSVNTHTVPFTSWAYDPEKGNVAAQQAVGD